MKRIEAVVRSTSIEDVRAAVAGLHIGGISVSAANGFNRRKRGLAVWCPTVYSANQAPESIIELIVPDSQVDAAVTTIVRTGKVVELGEGDVFLSTIEDAISVRGMEPAEIAVHE